MPRGYHGEVFERDKPMVGMLHVPALPGSPRNAMTFDAIRDFVLRDAAALIEGGVDGLMIENFGDVPFYPDRVPPHTIAYLTALAGEVRSRFGAPLGINVLRNDGCAAIAVAAAVGAQFVRVNVYTGARLADQGILQGAAHEITRYRKMLGADVEIWADIAVKHSAAIAERAIRDEVEDTIQRGLADAVIVSGSGTGRPTALDDLRRVKKFAAERRVIVGSGASAENVAELLAIAGGVIAGTSIKRDGLVSEPVDIARVRQLVAAARGDAV
jgi:uncharacterized protein